LSATRKPARAKDVDDRLEEPLVDVLVGVEEDEVHRPHIAPNPRVASA
jgi:hypothetical protein